MCVPVASSALEGRGSKDCEFHVKFSFRVFEHIEKLYLLLFLFETVTL